MLKFLRRPKMLPPFLGATPSLQWPLFGTSLNLQPAYRGLWPFTCAMGSASCAFGGVFCSNSSFPVVSTRGPVRCPPPPPPPTGCPAAGPSPSSSPLRSSLRGPLPATPDLLLGGLHQFPRPPKILGHSPVWPRSRQ